MGKFGEFLSTYPNQNTRGGYSAAVYAYIDCIYGKQRAGKNSTEAERAKYEELIDQYLIEKREIAADLMKFVLSLNTRPPLSAKQTFNFVKEFLSSCDLEIRHQDLKRIRNKLPKGGAQTIEEDLDIESIRSILQHMDTKGKALVLVLASSGMRVGEALQINLEDIDLEVEPSVITIRREYTKTGYQRYSFISKEAKEAVQEWLKIRDSYLLSSNKRNNGLVQKGKAEQKSLRDNRLFPFSDQNASAMWNNALKKAGLDSQDTVTNRKQLHFHMFRKFFISQLSLKISKEIPEMLAGHKAYLSDSYRRYTKSQLAQEYLKAEYLVSIQTPKEIKEIENEFREKIADQSEIVQSLVAKNLRLGGELSSLKGEMQALNDLFKIISDNPELLNRLKEIIPLAQQMETQ
jgi:integrase